ncbi:MAG: sugar phosphate isomerase/epimerase [Treponema sp.]|jgi:sugar phosphate isomerase/epimerase|nr:sugar phosphate isomerase/epimerase [Treponema sp.]
MTGVTSVTFRKFSPEKIISLAKNAGLRGIEWGGDVHVPPVDGNSGENSFAAAVRDMTTSAELTVLSYGSYHKLCAGLDFAPVLAAARTLGAPLIRVWAGTAASAAADDEYYRKAAKELRDICLSAADAGIKIGLEYHRGTLTDTAASAKKLVLLTGQKNLRLYWQPNPDIPADEHYREIALLLPWISYVHVFFWEKGNIRRPLADGEAVWKEYIRLLGHGKNYIMEFVQDDREDNFLADARVLARLCSGENPESLDS